MALPNLRVHIIDWSDLTVFQADLGLRSRTVILSQHIRSHDNSKVLSLKYISVY